MIGGVDRPPDRGDVVAHRRAGVDVHGEHRFDRAVGVGPQTFLDVAGIDRRPVGRVDGLDLDARHRGHLAPHDREPARLEHEHTVATRQRVADRHLPRAVTVRHGDERRRRRAGDAGELLEDLVGDVEQLARVDVGHRPVHRRQHSVGDHRRPGDRHHVTTVVERSLHAMPVSHLPLCVDLLRSSRGTSRLKRRKWSRLDRRHERHPALHDRRARRGHRGSPTPSGVDPLAGGRGRRRPDPGDPVGIRAGGVPVLARRLRLAAMRGGTQRPSQLPRRDRRARHPLPARPLAARRRHAAGAHPRLAGLDRRVPEGDRAAHRPDRARRHCW